MKTIGKSFLAILLLAAVLMAGCKKENNTDQDDIDATEYKNPNPAQFTPLAENYLSEFVSVFQVSPNADGTYYALSMGEHTDYLLKLDNNGYVQQRVELGFHSRRCITRSAENIVLIGNLGEISSPFSMFEQGYVVVYDQNMQLIATTTLQEPQYKIEIYTLIQDIQDPTVFYVGGAAVDGNYQMYPYLCTLKFSEGVMAKESSKVYTDYVKCRVIGMVEKQTSGQKDLILETIHYTAIDGPYNNNSSVAHIVKLNYFEEESGWGSKTWDLAITGPHGNSYAGNNSIDADDNNIYFFGYCNDDKEPAPSNGSYWHSGLVAVVNWRQGQLTGTKTLSMSNKTDRFYDGVISGGYLYACGMHSGVSYSTLQRTFSNGVVAKLNLSGELISFKTFGKADRDSYLLNLVKDHNDNWVCVGESGENLGEDKMKWSGWFMKTDMTFGASKAIPDGGLDSNEDLIRVMDAASACVPVTSDLN